MTLAPPLPLLLPPPLSPIAPSAQYMNDDPSAVDVLYIGVADDTNACAVLPRVVGQHFLITLSLTLHFPLFFSSCPFFPFLSLRSHSRPSP